MGSPEGRITLEDRIAFLEERIRGLESDLARHERQRRLDSLRAEGVTPAVAEMLMTLYEAEGRRLSIAFLQERCCTRRGGVDAIRWYAHLARKELGRAVILTHPRPLGYSMNADGRRIVEEAWTEQ